MNVIVWKAILFIALTVALAHWIQLSVSGLGTSRAKDVRATRKIMYVARLKM